MKKILPYIFVVIALLIAGGIYIDKTSTTTAMPKLESNQTAPEFSGVSHWLNSEPLTMQSLRGKVVLVDFWTYSCIDCIRTLPYVTTWYNTYKDKGLVVVGVHTPEFAFEKDTSNVARAIDQFKIHYPVAQDNDFGTWNAYHNQYWPAEFLIDQKGNIVHTHFGEGEYDKTENAIRELLGMNAAVPQNDGADLSQVKSPEMYFGTDRLEYLSSAQTPSAASQNYTFGDPDLLALHRFEIQGSWKFTPSSAITTSQKNKIRLHFSSAKIYMVAQSETPTTLQIWVDGKAQPNVTVSLSQLYTLFDSVDYSEHVIEISIPDAGFEAFTFTFG